MVPLSLMAVLACGWTWAQNSNQQVQTWTNLEVSDPVTPAVFNGDVRDLPLADEWQPGQAIKEIPRRHNNRDLGNIPTPIPKVDSLLEIQERAVLSTDRAFGDLIFDRDGQGFTGVNPPDTVGDIGPNYYIQAINASGGATFVIYDKVTEAVVAGPTKIDSLGTGSCAVGAGDPIVQYDWLADRWILSEFSGSANALCIYVSQTSDPVAGGWFNYQFNTPNFPDYPKYGVWPTAIFVGTNEASSALYALDRVSMLAGMPATSIRFPVADLAGFGFQMIQPADLDGFTPPPGGEPGIFMRHRDDEAHNVGSNDPTKDFLEIFTFNPGTPFGTGAGITGPMTIDIAEIDSHLCGFFTFSCLSQPSGVNNLDPLREVVMHRLQYRNFGTHETLVGCLVTDVDGTDHAGTRWFELRRTGRGAGWVLHQEGTYSIDGDNRWMGSIAMDQQGNIAMGYNVGSSSTFPSIRYVGRTFDHLPLGEMNLPEVTAIAGSASNGSIRYGDYSSLNVDPDDDCTFWFTGEYNAASAWSTRIFSFRFDNCGGIPACGDMKDLLDRFPMWPTSINVLGLVSCFNEIPVP